MIEKDVKVELRNTPCKYFNGNDGFCLAKDCVKCNPVSCKIYETTDEELIKSLYKQLQRKEEELEKFRKANDEKNEFLQKLGISATGEFKRISQYISQLEQQNKRLREVLKAISNAHSETVPRIMQYATKALKGNEGNV